MKQELFREFRVSKMVIGTAQFGLRYGVASRTGQPGYKTVCGMLEHSFSEGVNALDTAALYGESEKVIGRALKDLRLREKAFVISKVPWIHGCVDPEPRKVARFVSEELVSSLRNLQLEYLPLYLLHRGVDLPYLEHLTALKEQGLVRYVGVSVASPEEAAEAVKSGVDAIQHPTSVLDQRFLRRGLFEKARDKDVALFLRSVFLQGLLVLPEKEIVGGFMPLRRILRELSHFAGDWGISLSELALRYVISIPGTCGIVIGMENLEQMDLNLRAFSRGELPPALVGQIASTVPELPDRLLDPARWPAAQEIDWCRN